MTTANASFKNKAKKDTLKKPTSLRNRFYFWARWLHVYISTATLFIVLFFSVTGITLNHPDWMFGTEVVRQEFSGALPANWENEGQVDWLKISEYMRTEHNVNGRVADYWSDAREGQLSFSAPAYSADVFLDIPKGEYTLYTDAQGFVVAMNDLHRGRDAGVVWRWVIDLSAVFLILVSITGLALLILLKKIRMKGMLAIVAGGIVSVVLMMIAL